MKKLAFFLIPLLLLAGCNSNRIKVTVENTLSFDRKAETVEISLGDIKAKLGEIDPAALVVTDSKGTEIPSQLIYAGKGEPESLIFQADVTASTTAKYYIAQGTPQTYEAKAYGRFVPERYDDYAWENDRIAF
ncbi:DUF4861 domain-containing protein, partial [bacterium]|nr:DUF4861 domain-containing protein [bacterium]